MRIRRVLVDIEKSIKKHQDIAEETGCAGDEIMWDFYLWFDKYVGRLVKHEEERNKTKDK